jgi:hypothetical protein
MKKSLLLLFCTVVSLCVRSQCVISCSNYAVSSITHSVFPATGPNLTGNFSPNQDDGSTSAIPIGFSFNFYCTTYTNVYICSNGFIQFTPVSWSHGSFVHATTVIPTPSEPNNQIAFNQTDLDPSQGGIITYATIGTAPNRQFIVTYSMVPAFTATNVPNYNTGQIVLYETTNVVEIHTGTAYGDSNQGFNGTQGIENASGTIGKYVTGRNQSSSWFPGTNTAYRFTPDYEPSAPAAILGDTLFCQGSTATYSVNSVPSATAYTWSHPFGWTPSVSGPLATYTMPASGTISLTASYSCGTSPATTLAVTIIPAPGISVKTPTPNILCSGIPVTFSASGADTYTMNPGNITGPLPFTDMPLTSTVYSITGTSSVGCVSMGPGTVLVTVNTTPTVTVNSGAVCQGAAFQMSPSAPGVNPNGFSYQGGFSSVTQTVPGVYAYTVVGTGTNGCKSDPAIASLTVFALPNVTAFATRTVICKGETSTVTANGAVSYVWTNTTATSNSMIVNPVVITNYSVTGTDVNGCVKGTMLTVNVSPCNGLSEAGGASRMLTVYPNPSSGEFTIECIVPVNAEVFDITGRKVYAGSIDPGNKTSFAAGLPAGQYILRATANDTQHNVVLIKE